MHIVYSKENHASCGHELYEACSIRFQNALSPITITPVWEIVCTKCQNLFSEEP